MPGKAAVARQSEGGGGVVAPDQLHELENIHSTSQRVNTLCVLSANNEPCGHLGAHMGLCPDIMRSGSVSDLPLFLLAAVHRWLHANCYATGNSEEE